MSSINNNDKFEQFLILMQQCQEDLSKLKDNLSDLKMNTKIQDMKIESLEKEISKITPVVDLLKQLEFTSTQLSSDIKKNIEEIEKIKEKYNDIVFNPEYHESNNKNIFFGNISISKLINSAPSIITIISFIGYIAYNIIIVKLGGGL